MPCPFPATTDPLAAVGAGLIAVLALGACSASGSTGSSAGAGVQRRRSGQPRAGRRPGRGRRTPPRTRRSSPSPRARGGGRRPRHRDRCAKREPVLGRRHRGRRQAGPDRLAAGPGRRRRGQGRRSATDRARRRRHGRVGEQLRGAGGRRRRRQAGQPLDDVAVRPGRHAGPGPRRPRQARHDRSAVVLGPGRHLDLRRHAVPDHDDEGQPGPAASAAGARPPTSTRSSRWRPRSPAARPTSTPSRPSSNSLDKKVAMSTVSVTLVTAANVVVPEEDTSGFLGGLKAGWKAFLGASSGVLTVLGAVLPVRRAAGDRRRPAAVVASPAHRRASARGRVRDVGTAGGGFRWPGRWVRSRTAARTVRAARVERIRGPSRGLETGTVAPRRGQPPRPNPDPPRAPKPRLVGPVRGPVRVTPSSANRRLREPARAEPTAWTGVAAFAGGARPPHVSGRTPRGPARRPGSAPPGRSPAGRRGRG